MTTQLDTFTDVDGTILELHVADTGFNWENFNPFHPTNAEIQGNALLGAEGFFRAFRSDFVPDEGDSVGVNFEVFDVADHDGIFLKLNIPTAGDIRHGYQIGWRNESTEVHIEILKNDNFFLDVILPVTTLGTHSLQAQVVEGRILAWLDGVLVASRTDPDPLVAGRHGFEILRSVGEVGCKILEWAYPATALPGNTLTAEDLDPHRVFDHFTDVDAVQVLDHIPDSTVPFTWLTHPTYSSQSLPILNNAVAIDGTLGSGGMVHTGIAPGTGEIVVEINFELSDPAFLTHYLRLFLLGSLTEGHGYELFWNDVDDLFELKVASEAGVVILATGALDRFGEALCNLQLRYNTVSGQVSAIFNGLVLGSAIDTVWQTGLVSSGFQLLAIADVFPFLSILDFGITSEFAPGGEVVLPPIPVVVPVEDVPSEEEDPFCQGITITQDEPAEVVFPLESRITLLLTDNEPCGTPVDLSGPFARCDHAEFIVLPLL